MLDLPAHVLVQIASHLDPTSLKALARSHPLLQPAAEVHLYRRISLPLPNPHRPVQSPASTDSYSWLECDYDLSTRWIPEKPSLAAALAERGWKEDAHRTNHLDASLQFLTDCLAETEGTPSSDGVGRRTKYPRELVIDCKKRYHDTELDMNTASLSSTTLSTSGGGGGAGAGYRGGMWFDGKDWQWEWDDPTASGRAMLHLAQARADEIPDKCPELRRTFEQMPVLPGVKRLTVEVYESWQGFLDHLFRLAPNVEHLVIRPNSLLVDSPLSFPARTWRNLPTSLRSLRVEAMLDCLQPLVIDLIEGNRQLERVELGDCQRGSRRKWTPTAALARSLHIAAMSERLGSIRVGRSAREVLQGNNSWPEGVLINVG